ncbi:MULTISPECIES: glutathione S-transferase family protein [unclassified Leptolyngbya]|uniref:glutathione S-transferase family protein n=1 Tax=unclassified Leptolyngbya TaxID=2650499 RepID=UPI0016821874|nr:MULTISPECIES: glutathione S-transferase family protein [unclassified Leptolyngbya]MBD1913948.1 glutathione S-transferase family protein [Leptolyngbya sp. FACHB-8]MBD2153491.1 glutathione S-transferase family protein [Leptolyngbya sp. FACHB-16]
MLELYQFELSHYCEKIRLILDYKGLPYRKVEVTPGIGQLEVFRMSGQRQVPVLKDGSEVIADSTAIAEYLERKYPDRPIIPTEPKLRGLTILMEQWADESVGLNARKCMLGAMGKDVSFRQAFLPKETPDLLKTVLGSVPNEVFGVLGLGAGLSPDASKTALDAMKRDLTALCFILDQQPFLVTDHPTLADFAVAALTMYVKFPSGDYLDLPDGLKGKGVPGIADVGTFEPFFKWRDSLYASVRKASATPAAGSGSGPTSINIE